MTDAPSPNRTSVVERETGETTVRLSLDLDGTGQPNISTGVGFLDHMLTLFARHSLTDLEIAATGDLEVDAHHTTEDVGICLGLALKGAVGDKAGMTRYGSCSLPMDETLVTAAIDFSGRPFYVSNVEFPTARVGEFDTELVREFWQAVSSSGVLTLHQVLHHGRNSHHIAEAAFKATARAIRQAVAVDPRQSGVPSSKGVL